MLTTAKQIKPNDWLRLITHGLAALPLLLMIVDYARDNLTVNPIQALTLRTGETGLILLVASLACTPLSIIAGWKALLTLRRPLGLWGFAYIVLHLLIFLVVDFGLDMNLIVAEISEKRYIIAGLAGFLLLLPLAITSTRGWQRRLGKNWKSLHRLVYLAVPLGVLHFFWLVKADIREPLIFALLVGGLLLLRLPPIKRWLQAIRQRQHPPSTSKQST
jgi:sulfoxide reductase heme-binding subunit YedZ